MEPLHLPSAAVKPYDDGKPQDWSCSCSASKTPHTTPLLTPLFMSIALRDDDEEGIFTELALDDEGMYGAGCRLPPTPQTRFDGIFSCCGC
jgi:hypothetical protein